MHDLWSHQKARELEHGLALRRAARRAAVMGFDHDSHQPRARRTAARLLRTVFRRPARQVRSWPGVLRRRKATGV